VAATNEDSRSVEGGLDLFLVIEQVDEIVTHTSIDERVQVGANGIGDRFAGEVPQDRTYLELGMERQSIIDSPDMAVFAEQHMATFAVSAVRHDVEGRQLLEGALELRFVIQGQVVLFEVAWNEQLPPVPTGPSTRTVGGTKSHPMAFASS